MGTLYLVATPIGNLSDFSPRGVEVLKSVNKIYSEDTRRTIQLLNHFQISKPLQSFHEHNEDQIAPIVLNELQSSDIALVSDAGTPTISDPGFKLVREATKAGDSVISIPGPNAALLALSVSGLPTDKFAFIGFLPKKDGPKRRLLEDVKTWPVSTIFYESPYRLKETLQTLQAVLGDREASVSRELTKVHEETVRGRLSELLSQFSGSVKGEITIVVAKDDAGSPPPSAAA